MPPRSSRWRRPPRTYAYCLMLSPDFSQPDGLAVVDVDPASPRLWQDRPHGDDAEQGRRVSSLRLERLFVGAVAAVRSCVSGTPVPDHPRHSVLAHLRDRHQAGSRHKRRSTRSSSRRKCSARPAIPGPTRSIAGRKASMSRRSAAVGADGTDGPPGIFIMDCETFDVHRPLGDRPRAAGQALRFLVEPAARLHGVERMGRCRRSSRTASCRRTCSPTNMATGCTSGICARGAMSRPSTSGANHQMALEVRPAHDPVKEYGFVGVVVDTTNLEGSIWTWWREDGTFHCEKTATIPPEPADTNQLAAAAAGLRRRAAADHRHRPLARRPVPLCLLLGHRRDAPVRRQRSDASRSWPGRCISAASPGEPPHPNGKAYGGRAADGRDQPRRQAGLLDEFALFDLGRPVLSGRRAGGDGQGRRRADGGLTLDKNFWVEFPEGLPVASDPAGGRRLLDRLLLLSVGLKLVAQSMATAGLWLAVVASGLYHGLNPGMGWPLAVSAGLMGRGRGTCVAALASLAAGHFLAMLVILLPFCADDRSGRLAARNPDRGERRSSSPSACSALRTVATRACSPGSGRRGLRSGPSPSRPRTARV